ncbi:MAG: hypothetical protein ACLP4V_30910 [Methylocella sp.]
MGNHQQQNQQLRQLDLLVPAKDAVGRQRLTLEIRKEVLVAVARYLAAHSPTERGWLQTADIAARLSRGDQLHADEPPVRP